MGFNGGGFGRAPGVGATPQNWTQANAGINADPWAGAGATGLSQQTTGVQSINGVWSSKGCAPCDTAIRTLQNLLNRITGAGLTADGRVGPATGHAMAQVATLAQNKGMVAEAVQLARVGSSPELIAKNADWLGPIVQTVATKIGAVNAATAPQPFQQLPAGPPPPVPQPPPPGPLVTANASPGIFAPGSTWRQRLPYIAGGLILMVGVGAAILILVPKERHEAEAE